MNTFDTEKFIMVIEDRPALYNMKLKDYNNRDIKVKLWDEVAAEMIEDWEKHTQDEKNKIGKELQTKWKSIRDQFRREWKQLQTGGQLTGKKKKYVFFDQLLFLTDHVCDRKSVLNMAETKEEVVVEGNASFMLAASQREPKRQRKYAREEDAILKDMRNISSMQRNDSTDIMGNKLFLLSFLPLLDKLPDNLLIETRMSIMQAVQQSYYKYLSSQDS